MILSRQILLDRKSQELHCKQHYPSDRATQYITEPDKFQGEVYSDGLRSQMTRCY
jgi:hypothetical protein